MERLLSEQEVKKWLDRWIGYLDEDMIYRMKIGTKDIPSAEPKTCYIEKSNFDMQQYKLDTDTAYECGYKAGLKSQNNGISKAIPSSDKWIPVSERLPQKDESVLLTICANSKISIFIPFIIDENINKYNSSSDYYNDICYTTT